LYKPPGKGPFPAVIVLHTCGGIQDYLLDFADDLSDEGYVTPVVDYLSAPCGSGFDADVVKEELRIIAEAYDQLKAQPAVDPDRIGMVGFSRGSNRALIFAQYYPDRKIRGIVSYFVGCWRCGYPAYGIANFPPILFLHGDLDRIQPFRLEKYCSFQRPAGNICEVHIYKGVYHNFLKGDFNAFAEADAFKRAVAFFEKHVKGKSK